MQIGPYRIEPALALAPMAGVTDRAFRTLCRRWGAGLAASEMTIDDPRLWNTPKSLTRMDHRGEPEPIAVQIAGSDPARLAQAARLNVERGAQIIDINMGCPAKKVCNAEAGSALMRDEALVERICRAAVEAVDVPVTLKIRTGWAREHRNGVAIARIAENCGVAALAVHGRTREDLYAGAAEYDTIAAIKQAVRIPVWANGDIDSVDKAQQVLSHTGADGLMIGRAAQGRPWIFRQIAEFLGSGTRIPSPAREEVGSMLLEHLNALYALYGDQRGVRVARKHIQWYCQDHSGSGEFWKSVNATVCADRQRVQVAEFFGLPAIGFKLTT